MVWNGQEKRRFFRAIFPCRIEVDSPIRLLVSHTENIGEGGVRVFLEQKLVLTTTVGLELFLEKEKPIKCSGKVVWVKEKVNPIKKQPLLFDTGIEFIGIDDSDKLYIRKLVDTIRVQDKE